ncbi:hypothetical protein BBFGKLBO_03051 [Synechococcus sp. CBW1107]|nr:hypothetical protein BBFGKLBO_03051 [Synechococcus sp. CBW1107]
MVHLVQVLFAVSQPVVNAIGPWEEARRAPPDRDTIRLTFLVSDGLYFGEAPMTVMQREPMAPPPSFNGRQSSCRLWSPPGRRDA